MLDNFLLCFCPHSSHVLDMCRFLPQTRRVGRISNPPPQSDTEIDEVQEVIQLPPPVEIPRPPAINRENQASVLTIRKIEKIPATIHPTIVHCPPPPKKAKIVRPAPPAELPIANSNKGPIVHCPPPPKNAKIIQSFPAEADPDDSPVLVLIPRRAGRCPARMASQNTATAQMLPHMCGICSRRFETERGLKIHTSRTHNKNKK
jgi:hypothetical protein